MSRRKRKLQIEERSYLDRVPCDGTGNSFSSMEGLYPANAGAGVYVNSHTALSLPGMWGGVTRIVNDIASLPVNISQVTPQGRVAIHNDPRQRLLDHEANPFVDAYAFESAMFHDAIVEGNGYAEIVRDPDTLLPIALFNIPHHAVTPEIIKDPENSITGNRLVYRLDTAEGDKSYLMDEDVIHLKGNVKGYALVGISLIDHALQSLGLAIACQTNASAYFSQGSRADGFLKFNGTMTPKQREDYRKDFYADHGGVYRSNRLGFLAGDFSWIATSNDPQKSQLLEQRQYSQIEINQWLNLPQTEGLTYEQRELAYVKQTLRPWLERYELELCRKLFAREEQNAGYEFRHDLRAMMRGDSAAIAHFAATMLPIGALNDDEVRSMFDAAPVEHGQTYYLATNNLTPIGGDNHAPMAAAGAPNAVKALPGPDQSASEASQHAITAVRSVLAGELSRIVRREATALRKTLGKPEKVAEFYGNHEALVRESIGPALHAYGVVSGKAFDVERLVERLVKQSQVEIEQAEDPGMVLDGWLQGKVEAVIAAMEQG